MALLQAVVSPQNNHPCCRSCGTSCILCSHGITVGIAGEVEGTIKRGVVVQDDEELLAAVPPHGKSACCAWAHVAGTSWARHPVPSTFVTTTMQAAPRTLPRRRRRGLRGVLYAKAAGSGTGSVVQAESHRLNHIAVERNRRRKMNEYLAALRRLMPPSYARRGDQASIVGGAIDFVKELEHHLQRLQAQTKRPAAAGHSGGSARFPGLASGGSARFPGFFTFPQYSSAAAAKANSNSHVDEPGSSSSGRPSVADVEAAVSEGHATVKVLAAAAWRPGQQLPRMLLELQRRDLPVVHLNVTTTADRMVFYTFSLRMGEGCQLSSADDVADAVHSIVVAAGVVDDGGAEQRAIYPPLTHVRRQQGVTASSSRPCGEC